MHPKAVPNTTHQDLYGPEGLVQGASEGAATCGPLGMDDEAGIGEQDGLSWSGRWSIL